MSEERVLFSKVELGLADDGTIGSLNQTFTGQKEKVNTLDKRMEEYIEQEMAKRKEQRKEDWNATELVATTEENNADIEDQDSHAKKTSLSKQDLTTQPQKSETFKPVVIDLSDTVLRVAPSSAPSTESERRFHKSDGARSAVGILEVDLPVEEQLKMIEQTRLAALKALEEEKKKRHRQQDQKTSDFFEALDASAPGNLSVNFSKCASFIFCFHCVTGLTFASFQTKRLKALLMERQQTSKFTTSSEKRPLRCIVSFSDHLL